MPEPYGSSVFIVTYSNCYIFPGISSKLTVTPHVLHFGTWEIIPRYHHISGYHCVAKSSYIFNFPPHKCKNFLQTEPSTESRGVSDMHPQLCKHHHTANGEVFTALPGGCARTGFCHSRQTEWGDCRGRWEQDRNDEELVLSLL